MNPNVTNINEEDGVLKFRLTGVNMSLANALRRIILSEIETVVFRTAPYNESKATIEKNTSRLNNELIKQRLSCVPIHIKDTSSFPIQDYVMELDVKNETDSDIYVTTEDFKVKNIQTNIYLPKEKTKEIFPPNDITNMYIDLVRLRPKLADNIPGELLKMSCLFDIGTAKQDGMFNVVSTCSYGFTVDKIAQADAWGVKEKEYDSKISKDELESLKKNWLLLEGKRITVPDSFEFIIESVGVFENMTIVEKGCDIMLKKLKKFITTVQNNLSDIIIESNNTISNCYDIKLVNEDYTLGKVLEYILYKNYYLNKKIMTYCGFQKPHPHIDVSIIRLGFKEPIDNENISKLLINSCTEAIGVFEKMKGFFETNDN